MSSESDSISVDVSERRVVTAVRATAHLTLSGASFVRGGEPHRKAKEIAELASALRALGIAEDAIRVTDVVAHVESGLLTKSSSATYRLTVDVVMEALPALIGAIGGQRNLKLERLSFDYAEDPAERDAWAASLARKALARADILAEALGVTVLGVASLEERFDDGEAPAPVIHDSDVMVVRSAAPTPIEPGVPLIHEKTVTLALRVRFRVGPRA